MVVGSTLNDVLLVNATSAGDLKSDEKATPVTKEPLCRQKV